MSYDPALAIDFAKKFWNRPCKSKSHSLALGLSDAHNVPLDGFWKKKVDAASASDFEPLFVFNPATDRDDLKAVPKPGARAKDKSVLSPILLLDGKTIEDCAHFLSQCLIAGGLKIDEQWSVPMLLIALRETEDYSSAPIGKTLAEKVSRKEAQRIIDAGLMHVGDMIGYFVRKGFQHSAMFTGKLDGAKDATPRVTCHTKSRFMGLTPPQVPDFWFLADPDYLFTLVHIPENNSPPPLGDAMAGWWKFDGPQGTEFFSVRADGRAIRTKWPPKSAKLLSVPGAGDRRGYWFSNQIQAQFCWRDGRVDKMTMDTSKKTAAVEVVQISQGTAIRVDL